jgi:EAL domain-containing protein (putative c-di-GMP-specific phosphodiesterase class I)
LKYLPFSDLKIDGEFIRHLAHNPADQQIVRAISELARGLGKATIAEFVGDAQTAVLLANYGVDFAQGYFIGEPLPWRSQPDLALPGEHQTHADTADVIR